MRGRKGKKRKEEVERWTLPLSSRNKYARDARAASEGSAVSDAPHSLSVCAAQATNV